MSISLLQVRHFWKIITFWRDNSIVDKMGHMLQGRLVGMEVVGELVLLVGHRVLALLEVQRVLGVLVDQLVQVLLEVLVGLEVLDFLGVVQVVVVVVVVVEVVVGVVVVVEVEVVVVLHNILVHKLVHKRLDMADHMLAHFS